MKYFFKVSKEWIEYCKKYSLNIVEIEITLLLPAIILSSVRYAIVKNKSWLLVQGGEKVEWTAFLDKVGVLFDTFTLVGLTLVSCSFFFLQMSNGQRRISSREVVDNVFKNLSVIKILLFSIIVWLFFFYGKEGVLVQCIFSILLIGFILLLHLSIREHEENLLSNFLKIMRRGWFLFYFTFILSIIGYFVFTFLLATVATFILVLFELSGMKPEFSSTSFIVFFSLRFISFLSLPLFLVYNFLFYQDAVDERILKNK